jgi:hypothetical protein
MLGLEWKARARPDSSSGFARTSSSEPAEDWPALKARKRRWAELLRMVFQVEVEVCPRGGGEALLAGGAGAAARRRGGPRARIRGRE